MCVNTFIGCFCVIAQIWIVPIDIKHYFLKRKYTSENCILFMLLLTNGSALDSIFTKVTNKFALDVYEAIGNSSRNIIVSPISLHLVLAMALQGAKGTTELEIDKVLNLSAENKPTVLDGYKNFIADLQDPVLKLAAKIFIEKTCFIYPHYYENLSYNFLSEIHRSNFMENPAESTKEINFWVQNQTENKIKELLSPDLLTSDTKLVLASAIHFKANWKLKFNKKYTKVDDFYVKPDVKVKVDMMSLTGNSFRTSWNNDLGAQIIEIPYTGNIFKMVIILPNDIDGLAEVESKLSSIELDQLLSSLIEQPIDVYLPKFKLRKNLEMNDILSKMGMLTAFSEAADFSGISNTSLLISNMVHKAYFAVNEKGSEGAAATGVVISAKSMPLQFVCDHPFIFMVMKRDIILFTGRLSKPNV